MKTANEIKQAVKEKYGEIAQGKSSCCGGPKKYASSSVIRLTQGYDDNEVNVLPEDSDLGLGCGFPTRSAKFETGQTVLDLGSGAGVDCFLAAKAVGPDGKVIGIDMTDEMIEKARANAKQKGFTNVEFRLGEIEDLPVDSDIVDIVISNCVLNLVPDKEKAFSEIYRVLKPGGYFVVSDVVYVGEMPKEIREKMDLWTGCLAGAVQEHEYIEIIQKSGFYPVNILTSTKLDQFATDKFFGQSVTVQGIKPKTETQFGEYE
jgi:arsenite methyltransferase